MVHIDKCPKCNQRGFAYKKFFKCGKPSCKCAKGFLHGPYLIVEHYEGYDSKKEGRKRITKICYISVKKIAVDERERLIKLLEKYEG